MEFGTRTEPKKKRQQKTRKYCSVLCDLRCVTDNFFNILRVPYPVLSEPLQSDLNTKVLLFNLK